MGKARTPRDMGSDIFSVAKTTRTTRRQIICIFLCENARLNLCAQVWSTFHKRWRMANTMLLGIRRGPRGPQLQTVPDSSMPWSASLLPPRVFILNILLNLQTFICLGWVVSCPMLFLFRELWVPRPDNFNTYIYSFILTFSLFSILYFSLFLHVRCKLNNLEII